jgi:hypothetical protein
MQSQVFCLPFRFANRKFATPLAVRDVWTAAAVAAAL